MKNKEYLFNECTGALAKAWCSYGLCDLCGDVGCRQFCRDNPKLTCEETFKTWLEQEHIELLYPIGTVVEFDIHSSMSATNRLGYYNGFDGDNTHRICIFKENIGKPHLGFLVNAQDIKKVGD